MDSIIRYAAWALVVWGVLELMNKLFLIGKTHTVTYSPGVYLIYATVVIATLLVAGRILGCW